MGIKKTLGLGVASAALGLSLIGGGTFAYFSDTAQSTATFAAGTLDLTSDPSVIVDISNLKPGDTVSKTFKLKNSGSLDIGSIKLKTTTEVTDTDWNNNGVDLSKFIKVKFLVNKDKATFTSPTVVYETTLAALQAITPDLVDNQGTFLEQIFTEADGIKAGTEDSFAVQFEFVDSGEAQNYFQKDKIKLTWDFEAKQGAKKAY